jgi:serine/threonine protein kinase
VRDTDCFSFSSAKDQLTGQNVAVKKIMKPFSTPVLSKRTYRELKLLKHLKHENVCFGILVRLLFMLMLILDRLSL